MSTVRFSVVIPTRERAETLRFALRTCLDQAFDDFEVVVSDNFSSPATREVVEACGSPKVRYVRTPEPLAMSNNWEFGLAHARGEYVILIGDDDGLLPHALAELDRLFRARQPRVIRWSAAFYTWPSFALPGQGDYLRLPLGCTLRECKGPETIRAVAEFRAFYTDLPMLYNSAIRRDVLDEMRRHSGRVIPHPIPDIYSGFAVAYLSGWFLSSTVPMSISGLSRASNGVATLLNTARTEIDREFHALNAKDGLRHEPTVPNLPVFPHVPVADAFAFAKRTLFPDIGAELDRRELTRACVRGARVREGDWPAALAAIRDSLADVPDVRQWFDAEFADSPHCPPPPVQLRPRHLGFDGEHLHLDTATFGISDVAGAAQFCERLLNYCGRPISYVPMEEYERAELKVTELAAVCAERERAILRLHLAANEYQQTIQELQTACDERERAVRRQEAAQRELLRQFQAERRWSLKRPLRAARRALAALGLRVG
jgi:hypothetical protein